MSTKTKSKVSADSLSYDVASALSEEIFGWAEAENRMGILSRTPGEEGLEADGRR